ncbi:hypothetical protein [Microbacterium sp. TNHR37B]|uniref:hypothetical protein n=1 Tax=Microbacterium sp. TNHR37B TaxID=1775956 RepID=UPI0007B1CD1A|nr:hypothetical protein [Microbacterium sp. TNHR37B]KZE89104.1 hypothetical protein AVP41_01895 [Microbacterium sp. TNHR37B]
MSSNTIRLILEVTRESDDSFSISLEDEHFGDSDERYVDGLSEGEVFDPFLAAQTAEKIIGRYLSEPQSQSTEPVISGIARPWEFKRAV